ncbi:hypothetical protein VPHD69_0189 [Vibrio phage D69]
MESSLLFNYRQLCHHYDLEIDIMNNEMNAAIEAGITVSKPGKLKALVTTAKNAPIKTTAIVVGTAAAVAGSVYGVKKFKQYRQNKAEGTVEAEFTEAKEEAGTNA